MKYPFALLFVSIFNVCKVSCLENGLARTPPMGWLAWERFKCNIRCDIDPANCISERLFMDMADKFISDGYKDAGYKYINIDDCWMASERDENGDLMADPIRFPRGIHFLSNYMHARGLKLGIYQSYGLKTCMGFPGIMGHIQKDVKKFAEWDVDMIKLDGCYTNWRDLDRGYISVGKYLQSLKKPILYSCSWPYYMYAVKIEPNYTLISSHCNMWRNYIDITDSWEVIERIIDFFGDNQEVITPHTGPGRWSDPDMLMIGNRQLTAGQSRAQMAVWAMIPGPLLMSNDLRNIHPDSKAILLNKVLIAINQDHLGIPGKRVYKEDNFEIWKRPISPTLGRKSSYAILFLNRNFKNAVLNFSLSKLNLRNRYFVTNVFSNKVFIIKANDTFLLNIPSTDVVMLNCRILS